MYKNLKRRMFLFVLLGIIIFTTIPTTITYAHTSKIKNYNLSAMYNIGVSDISPENTIATRGVGTPTKVWNIKEDGKYNFAGSSSYQTLYTNYKFTGKTSYKVYVENTGKTPITVKAKRKMKTYASTKISAGKSAAFEFSNIKSDTNFYIVFEGDNYSFEGYIE